MMEREFEIEEVRKIGTFIKTEDSHGIPGYYIRLTAGYTDVIQLATKRLPAGYISW